MKKHSTLWVVIGLLLVVAVGTAVYFGNTGMQKGAFQLPSSFNAKKIQPVGPSFTFDSFAFSFMPGWPSVSIRYYTKGYIEIRGAIYDAAGNFVKNTCESLQGDVTNKVFGECTWDGKNTQGQLASNRDTSFKFKLFGGNSNSPLIGGINIDPSRTPTLLGESPLFHATFPGPEEGP